MNILRVNFCVVAVAANPYAIWALAFHDVFADVVEYLDEIPEPVAAGSVEEALLGALGTQINILHIIYALRTCLLVSTDEVELWSSTEGAIEALIDFINRTDMAYPSLPEGRAEKIEAAVGVSSSSRGVSSSESVPPVYDAEMYKGMFRTAIEMISQLRIEGDELVA